MVADNDFTGLLESPHELKDFEVLGLQAHENGESYVVQWDGDTSTPYDSGETLEVWGIHNLEPHEAPRVGLTERHVEIARNFREEKGHGPTVAELEGLMVASPAN